MSTAALLTAANTPLRVLDIVWLQPQYGQVMVEVVATGICGAQLQECRGEKGSYYPRLIGHEAAGKVVSVGPGVKKVTHGDLVVCHWRKGDGIESESPRWRFLGKEHTAGQVTTFSQLAVVSENRVTKVPQDTPVELCSLLGCALSTALGTIENEANLKFGESVLIIGCGGLGLNLILAAKLRGASKIDVIDISNEKMDQAYSVGATNFSHVWEPHEIDFPFDVVIDTSGDPKSISIGISCLAPSGRFVMVGQPKQYAEVVIPEARRMFEGDGKTITATQGGRFNPSLDIPRYVALYKAGLLNIDSLITHRFPLSQINEALEVVRQGQAGRVLILPHDER